MSKPRLSVAEIEGLSAVESPERHLFAVSIGGGGLIGVGIAIDRERELAARQSHLLGDSVEVGNGPLELTADEPSGPPVCPNSPACFDLGMPCWCDG